MRQFSRSRTSPRALLALESLEARCLLSRSALPFEPPALPESAARVPYVVTTDGDPSGKHLGATGKGLDGVVFLTVLWGVKDAQGNDLGHNGSGALALTGKHVLTAAHVLTDANGAAYTPGNITVEFRTPEGTVTRKAKATAVHPNWTGRGSYDIGVIELESAAPASAPRYDLYRASDEVGRYGLLVGYGSRGTGAGGEVSQTQGTRRFGWNRYEAAWDGRELAYDFDSGLAANDASASAWIGATADLGLGALETNSAHGDSGGPIFVGGRIAGVVSGGYGNEAGDLPTDVDTVTNSSFGEISVDTRVSAHQGWLDGVLGNKVIDDGDAGFSVSGWWGLSGLGGYGNDSRFSPSGSATYSFSGLTPGWYRVSLTLPGNATSTERAVYTLTGGATPVTFGLDQRPGTNGWLSLDDVQVTGSTLQVQVAQRGRSGSYVRADALLVERRETPTYQTVDDGDVGFTRSGTWTASGLGGYAGDSLYAGGGSATYSFTGLAPGKRYTVLVNTPGHENSTDRALYAITGGTTALTVALDQRPGTNGWQALGTVEAAGSGLVVKLTQGGRAGSTLRADAVRVQEAADWFAEFEKDLKAFLGTGGSGGAGGSGTGGDGSSPRLVPALLGAPAGLFADAPVTGADQGELSSALTETSADTPIGAMAPLTSVDLLFALLGRRRDRAPSAAGATESEWQWPLLPSGTDFWGGDLAR